MTNPLRDIPYGEHPADCDFTIGEVKTAAGGSIFGVIWYAGGEAWAWTERKAALASARDTAMRINIARKTGRTRTGLKT